MLWPCYPLFIYISPQTDHFNDNGSHCHFFKAGWGLRVTIRSTFARQKFTKRHRKPVTTKGLGFIHISRVIWVISILVVLFVHIKIICMFQPGLIVSQCIYLFMKFIYVSLCQNLIGPLNSFTPCPPTVCGFSYTNLQSQCNPVERDGSRRGLSSLQTGGTLRISFSQKKTPYLSVRRRSD